MPNVAYGCVFCITGKENIVAECIEKTCPGVRATAARQMKHLSLIHIFIIKRCEENAV